MCLNCRTPRSEEIHDLDSFELAFLTMIGRVEWVDPFDYAFMLMKAANSHDSKIILWGPEAEMLFRVTERGFEEILLPVIDKIIAAFDLSGDVTVDAARARALNMQLRNLGDEFAEYVKTPANAVFATIIENAEEHFTKQKDAVTKQLNEAGWRDYLRDANSNHLDAYLRKFPEDVIHPQIERAIALAETSASRRLIDRGVLSERIGRLGESARMSLSELTDVEAGLAWTGTGLGLASENGVTHYIIQAEEDNRTCPVCMRLNGRKVSVEGAANTLESVLAGHRRHRFPRVAQIDNVGPEEIEGMSLFPPFHPRCRCDLGFLWREPRVPARRPPGQGMYGEEVGIVPEGKPVSFQMLPDDWGLLKERREFLALENQLFNQGKMAGVKAVKLAKPGKHEIVVTYDKNLDVKAFARIEFPRPGAPHKFRIMDYHGFGADWDRERYFLFRDIAKHAMDEGVDVVRVIDLNLDARVMRNYGFKKSGNYWEIKGNRLNQFARVDQVVAPRPIPPPVPPMASVHPVPPGPAVYGMRSLEEELADRNRYIRHMLRDEFYAGHISLDDYKKIKLMAIEQTNYLDVETLAYMEQQGLKIKISSRPDDEGSFIPEWFEIRIPKDIHTNVLKAEKRRRTFSHEFAHAYDYVAGGKEKLMSWKASGWGRLDENDLQNLRSWYTEYTKGKGIIDSGKGFKFRDGNWVREYDAKVYPYFDASIGDVAYEEMLELWANTSARYSLYQMERIKHEKLFRDLAEKWKRGIPEAEFAKMHHEIQRWVNGQLDLDTFIEKEALRRSKWDLYQRQYGNGPLIDLVKKAYRPYAPQPMALRVPQVVKPAPPTPIPSSASAYFREEVRIQGMRVTRIELSGGGVNGAYELYLEDGRKFMWKPRLEEYGGEFHRNKGVKLRGQIPLETLWRREALASELDILVDGKLVPLTVVKEAVSPGPSGLGWGSAQLWKEDAVVALDYADRLGIGYPELRELIEMGHVTRTTGERLAFFDFWGANSDRHYKNYMIDVYTKDAIAIDNGLMFGGKRMGDDVDYTFGVIRKLTWDGLGSENKAYITNVIDREEDIIAAINRRLEPDDARSVVVNIRSRIDVLKKWKSAGNQRFVDTMDLNLKDNLRRFAA